MSAFLSNSIPIFILLCFIVLFHTPNITADEETLLLKECSSNYIFEADGTFQFNRNRLFLSLVASASQEGYSSNHVGDNLDTVVYGLAQCRADLSVENCRTCLASAQTGIQDTCNGKNVTRRFDRCMLRYSDVAFFSEVTSVPNNDPLTNQIDITGANLVPLREKRDLLIVYLSNKASTTTTRSKYSFAKIEYVQSEFLYGAAQCTGDLSQSDCDDCLKQLHSYIPSCCDGNGGATIAAESCYIRYGTEYFFDISESAIEMVPTSSPESPPPVSSTTDTNRSNGNDGGKSFNVLYIIVAIIATIMLQ